MAKKPSEYLKYLILLFVKRFYDNPQLQYADEIIKQWVDNFIRMFVNILYNGFIGYLALFGLTYLFGWNIYLGDHLWQLPFTIILIGIVSWFLFNFLKIIPPIFKITTRG